MIKSINAHNHLFLLLISSIIFGLDLNSSKILNSGIKNVLLPRKRTMLLYKIKTHELFTVRKLYSNGASVVDIYNFLPITKEYILSSVASNNIPRFKCLWNRFLLILKSFA